MLQFLNNGLKNWKILISNPGIHLKIRDVVLDEGVKGQIQPNYQKIIY